MANPEHTDPELKGLRRANRDDEQHWSDKGWQKIEGGRSSNSGREQTPASDERATIGADFTRSPFDESLARNEFGNPNLNPALDNPAATSATIKLLGVLVAILVFTFVIALLFWNFLPAVRHSPEQPAGAVHQKVHDRTGMQELVAMVHRSNERR